VSDANGQDPVLRRRAQFAALAALGQRLGWLLIVVAVVAFVIGLSTGFDPWGTVVVVALVACTLTLAPAIVLGYAVRAAAREDRGVAAGEARPKPASDARRRPETGEEGGPRP
jgi:hypothetical protein